MSRSMVASCGSGVTAAHIALAAHTVGTQITVYGKNIFEGVPIVVREGTLGTGQVSF